MFVNSWKIPKYQHDKKGGEGKDNGSTFQEKKDKIRGDFILPILDSEIKVDGKEQENEEHHPHTTVSWGQPRRLVKFFLQLCVHSRSREAQHKRSYF